MSTKVKCAVTKSRIEANLQLNSLQCVCNGVYDHVFDDSSNVRLLSDYTGSYLDLHVPIYQGSASRLYSSGLARSLYLFPRLCD